MKSFKLISVVIAMLLLTVKGFGQIETNTDTISKETSTIKSPAFHCVSSIVNENSQPLYVVDGKLVTAQEVKNINTEGIESVTVLKDAAATGLYGKGGINGVIIIKTKKLSKRELRKMKKKNCRLLLQSEH